MIVWNSRIDGLADWPCRLEDYYHFKDYDNLVEDAGELCCVFLHKLGTSEENIAFVLWYESKDKQELAPMFTYLTIKYPCII